LIFSPEEQGSSPGRSVALFTARTDYERSYAVGRDFEYHMEHIETLFASLLGLFFPAKLNVVTLVYSVASVS
jgi:hypothetical protein